MSRSFYLGETEVTNQQYAAALQWAHGQGYVTADSSSVLDNLDGSTQELLDLDDPDCQIAFDGSNFLVNTGMADHPVIEVTWYGTAAYCDWSSLREGVPRVYDHSTWCANGGNPQGARGVRQLERLGSQAFDTWSRQRRVANREVLL